MKQAVRKPRPHRPGPPHVALVVETSTTFGRQLTYGIARYIRETSPWSVYFSERSVYDSFPSWLKTWRGDGIISRAASPEVIKAALKLKIPVVDLNEQNVDASVPMISNDHASIGKMAAEHFLQRGYTRFGSVGYPGRHWSDCRLCGFADRLAEFGYSCEPYLGRNRSYRSLRLRSWELEIDDLAAWIDRLPKPIGIMTCDDFRGVQLLAACRVSDVAVPEQVAVLGVGGDDVACELANPPLSSVILNAQQMGYQAAQVLDALMNNQPLSQTRIKIPALDVVTRQSTDITAIVDPIVAQSVRFIREHACDGINVNDVLEHVLVSRTALQNHFRDTLGQSIHDVIVGIRVERAKQLLAQSTLSLQDIAERCGFKHVEYMRSVLKQRTGWTPAQYRKQYGHVTEKAFQVEAARNGRGGRKPSPLQRISP